MRYLLAFLSVFSVSIICADAVFAQAPAKPPSKRQQLQQDKDDCARQGIEAYRVHRSADCMNKKEMAPKEAARQKKAADGAKRKEERAERKQERTGRFEAAIKASEEAQKQRIVQENAARARRDECKKQAKEQNLHLVKRLNFIKSCMEKK